MSNPHPKAVTKNITIREAENDFFIRDLNANKIFKLNREAGTVWQMCDGKKSVEEIEKLFSSQAEFSRKKDVVTEVLRQLRESGLLEPGFSLSSPTRRNFFKTLGLFSAASLFLSSFGCNNSDSPYSGYIPVSPGSSGAAGTVLVTYVSTKTTSNTPENVSNCTSRATTGCKGGTARLSCYNEGHSCDCVCN